jgi:hypothetical protein
MWSSLTIYLPHTEHRLYGTVLVTLLMHHVLDITNTSKWD